MRFEDERYIRSYTRDTIAWKMLPWESKCLLQLLFRKVDRVGLLDVGEYGTEGIAAIVELPVNVVEAGLPKLLEKQMVQWTGDHRDVLFIPNFLAAQEAHTSDAQRKRDQRERATARARLQALGLESDTASRSVTDGHNAGQEVTDGHTESLRAVPTRADLTKENEQRARTRVDELRSILAKNWGAWGTKVLTPDGLSIEDVARLLATWADAAGEIDMLALAERAVRVAFVEKLLGSWSFTGFATPALFIKKWDEIQAVLGGVEPGRRGDGAGKPRDVTRGQVPVARGLDYSNGGSKP